MLLHFGQSILQFAVFDQMTNFITSATFIFEFISSNIISYGFFLLFFYSNMFVGQSVNFTAESVMVD